VGWRNGSAADALPLVAQDEGAEPGDFHVLTVGKGMAHVMENALDEPGRFGAGQAELAMNDVRQVGAGQSAVGFRVFIVQARDPEIRHRMFSRSAGRPPAISITVS
jgi:hypothetical protein